MKVKFKTSYASATVKYSPGAVGELPDDEAERFIAAGLAEAVEPEAVEPEVAVAEPSARRAATHTGRAKGRKEKR